MFKFYHEQEPIKSFVEAEQQAWQNQIDSLKEKVADQTQIISNQDEVIRLLKEKEEFIKKQ